MFFPTIEGYVGVCSAMNEECNNVTMCKSDECCVSDYGIVGQNEGPGSCQTMGKAGDSMCRGFML